MRVVFTFITTVTLLLAAAVQITTADDVNDMCMKASSASECAVKAQQSYNCAFFEGNCILDPCNAHNATYCLDMAKTTERCLYLPAAESYTCVSYHFLCNRVPTKTCADTGFCAIKSDTYCGYAVPEGTGTPGESVSECTAFPLWSIALLVLWIFIMLILIAVIALAMKRKTSSIAGVETSTVDVDNVAVREDNFNPGGLSQPLVGGV